MQFPDKLIVSVRSSDTCLPVRDIALVLILFAERKNDYYLGPVITDEYGRAEFTREQCEEGIRAAQEMFLMDYAGDMSTCHPVIEVRVHRPEHIAGMLEQYRDYPEFWGLGFCDPTRLFNSLENVKNADYEPAAVRATESQLLANAHLELTLSKKPR